MRKSIQALFLVLLLNFVISTPSLCQLSISVSAGYVTSSESPDNYALNGTKPWPAVICTTCPGSSNNNSDQDYKMIYTSEATGSSFVINVAYDLSPRFSFAVIYRSMSSSVPDSKRTLSATSLGVQPRINFVQNTSRVVPFLQAEFYFKNWSKLNQSAGTSTKYPGQTQPAFGGSYSSSLAVGGDLGLEITVIPQIHVLVTGGWHGMELGGSDLDNLVKSLNYGAAYEKPQNLEGSFFLQYAAGVKYIFGKGKKKRDF